MILLKKDAKKVDWPAIQKRLNRMRFENTRAYDPTIGVWLTEDPIGFEAGDPNTKRYVGNDPVNYVDRSGLWATEFLFGFRDYASKIRLPTAIIDDVARQSHVYVYEKAVNTVSRIYIDNIFRQVRVYLDKLAIDTCKDFYTTPYTPGVSNGVLATPVIYEELFHTMVYFNSHYNDGLFNYGIKEDWWYYKLLKSEEQYNGSKDPTKMAEEGASSIVNKTIGILKDKTDDEYWHPENIKKPINLPTYEQVLKDPEWKQFLIPAHDEAEGEVFYGDPNAKKPVSEKLYYATIAILFYGPDQPCGKDFTDLKTLKEEFDKITKYINIPSNEAVIKDRLKEKMEKNEELIRRLEEFQESLKAKRP